MDMREILNAMDEEKRESIIVDLARRGYTVQEFEEALSNLIEYMDPALSKIKISKKYLEEAQNE